MQRPSAKAKYMLAITAAPGGRVHAVGDGLKFPNQANPQPPWRPRQGEETSEVGKCGASELRAEVEMESTIGADTRTLILFNRSITLEYSARDVLLSTRVPCKYNVTCDLYS